MTTFPRPAFPSRFLHRRHVSAVTFLVAACTVATSAGAQTEVSRRVPASPTGSVVVSNLAGSVVVRGWDRAEVEVTGTLERDVERLDVEASGDGVEIEVILPSRGRNHGSADLELRVPSRSRVRLELVSASARVAEVTGEVRIESVSGGVEVDGEPSSIDVETVSGGIEIRSQSAAVSAESVSGGLRLVGVRGEVHGSTVSGGIEIRGEALGRVRLDSVSGTIDLDASLAPRADLSLETHSGSIDLALPDTVSARFEASTYSGRIRNALGPSAQKTGRYTPESQLEFSAGAGDASVRLETFSGSIEIRKR